MIDPEKVIQEIQEFCDCYCPEHSLSKDDVADTRIDGLWEGLQVAIMIIRGIERSGENGNN